MDADVRVKWRAFELASRRDPMFQRSLRFALTVSVVLLPALGRTALAAPAPAGDWRLKVDAFLLDSSRLASDQEFLVVLKEQASVREGARARPGKAAKGRYVYEQLRAVAEATQGPILAELARRGAPRQAFFVHNMIWARGDASLIEAMARRSDVARVHANPKVAMAAPIDD